MTSTAPDPVPGCDAWRRCGLFDAATLAALQDGCFPDDPWDAEAMAGLLTLPNVWGLLAVDKQAPVAYALLRQAADELEILTLGVRPDNRRSGWGRALLAEVIARAWRQNVAQIFLEVAQDNGAALALYRRLAFEQVGRRPAYYQRRKGGPCDALILRLTRNSPTRLVGIE
tara:strand:- start:3517 stop:4029 length:513 start_codon:yes stop_codon:yes gene_type:complete